MAAIQDRAIYAPRSASSSSKAIRWNRLRKVEPNPLVPRVVVVIRPRLLASRCRRTRCSTCTLRRSRRNQKGSDAEMAKSFDELVKRTTTKPTRAKAARRTQELLGQLLLSEIRQVAGKSQQQVADALGIKQPSLSKLEKQSDMQISTLRKIVKALGGELEISARSRSEPQYRSVRSIASAEAGRVRGIAVGVIVCPTELMRFFILAHMTFPFRGSIPMVDFQGCHAPRRAARRFIATAARVVGFNCLLLRRPLPSCRSGRLGPRADSRSLGRADLR